MPNFSTVVSTHACADTSFEMSVCTNVASPLPASVFIAAVGAFLVDLGDHDLGALGEKPVGVREPDALARLQ